MPWSSAGWEGSRLTRSSSTNGERSLFRVAKNAVSEDRAYWLAANRELEGVYAESRRENIIRLLEELAARLGPEDTLQLFLIGHGSDDGYDYRFNLPGPDITALRLSELLERFRTTRQVVVNMTSSSGASLASCSAKAAW